MFYLWEYLKTANKPIVLYGMGNGADLIINELENNNINISGVFASDGFAKKKIFHGFEVTDYKSLKAKLGDFIVLVAFGTSRKEVIDNIIKISLESELYIPDVPVYGNNIFNRTFADKNAERIRKVYNMLADQKSKEVFKNIINFKCGGRFDDLLNIQTEYSDDVKFLKLTDSETYLDLGAYNGDTVLLFNNFVSNYNKIIAVEPDVKNFAKLKNNTKNLLNIEYINKGIWHYDGELNFLSAGGRNTSALKGDTLIKVTSIDDILKNYKATFIKMDVEGSEAKAIKGAFNTIKQFKPKMQIACYHRSEDIFDIPLKVSEIRNDYKIYLRHQPCFPAWDTNYFFV